MTMKLAPVAASRHAVLWLMLVVVLHCQSAAVLEAIVLMLQLYRCDFSAIFTSAMLHSQYAADVALLCTAGL